VHPPEDAARAPEATLPAPEAAAPAPEGALLAPSAAALPPEVTVERLALPDGRAMQLYSWADTADAAGRTA
jgi:hypothetical protein